MADDANDLGHEPDDDASRNDNANEPEESSDDATAAAAVPVKEQFNAMPAADVRDHREVVQAMM
jgi:hypothetical protein